jgi:hypothetical protein
MWLLLELFWWITAAELLVVILPSLWWRRLLAPFTSFVLIVTAIALFVDHPSIPTLLLLVMSIYRVISLLRLVRARMHAKYLRRATRHASLWLIGGQAIVILVWDWSVWARISTYHLWLALTYSVCVCAIVLLASTIRHLLRTRMPIVSSNIVPSHDLPTLTVAIPARNETDDLERCLTSLVASNYPKLEILVLDDCSQNRRTPEIIRSYAHDGVRFIQGRVPEDNWLAKNQAYQQLLEEANGELLLFCGVDIEFAPNSLRALVLAMLDKKKTMVSIMPKNTLRDAGFPFGATLIQPIRYAWELALPRKLFRRPPVLSSCWVARRDMLTAAGGFAAVSRSIVPESYFARVSTIHDGYSFMQSNEATGIVSNKSFVEQQSTAIRTRYPQVHRRVELVMLLTVSELVGVILPYALFFVGLFGHLSPQLLSISAATIIMLTVTYVLIVYVTYRALLVRAIWMPFFAIVADVILLNYSMFRYEFSEVVWKGRNVCIPVMYAVGQETPQSVRKRN